MPAPSRMFMSGGYGGRRIADAAVAQADRERAHEAAQALVSDPGLSRLLTGWKQPEPPDEYEPAEPGSLRDRMSTITALRHL